MRQWISAHVLIAGSKLHVLRCKRELLRSLPETILRRTSENFFKSGKLQSASGVQFHRCVLANTWSSHKQPAVRGRNLFRSDPKRCHWIEIPNAKSGDRIRGKSCEISKSWLKWLAGNDWYAWDRFRLPESLWGCEVGLNLTSGSRSWPCLVPLWVGWAAKTWRSLRLGTCVSFGTLGGEA